MVEKREKRLGRGLDFFLSDTPAPGVGEEVTQVDVNSLVPSPYQPRVEFPDSELEDLSRSIRSSGLLQPILVRRVGDQHQIIAGERRWRAAKMAGLERIPALVREVNDHAAAVYGVVENLQRSDLNAIEKAKAFERIRSLTQGTPGGSSAPGGPRAIDRDQLPSVARAAGRYPAACFTWNIEHGARSGTARVR